MGFESKYQHFGAKSMNFIDLLRFSYIKPKKEIGEKISCATPASLRVRGTSSLASAAPQPLLAADVMGKSTFWSKINDFIDFTSIFAKC